MKTPARKLKLYTSRYADGRCRCQVSYTLDCETVRVGTPPWGFGETALEAILDWHSKFRLQPLAKKQEWYRVYAKLATV